MPSAKELLEETKEPEVTGMNRVVDFIAQRLNPEWFATSGRTLLETAQGTKTPITEKNFKPEELDVIRQLVDVKGKDKGSISYADYIQLARKIAKEKGEPLPSSVTPSLFSMADPLGNIQTTLGRFTYQTDPKGNLQIIDRYDFNPPMQQDMREARTGDYGAFGPYGMIREYAGEKIPPGKGRDVRINLGPRKRFEGGGEVIVPRGTSEVPQLDPEGRLIDENAEMRSESQRMLNRLKAAQQESYRRGKLPPGIQRVVMDVMSEEKPPLIRGPVIQAGRDIVGGVVGATPTEPTNPSNLQRLVQGFTGAYLPTAPVVRTAQAAKIAAQEPRATMSAAGRSARESLEALGDIPVALAQPNQLGSQAGAVRLGGKESGNKPNSIFTPLPKADAPFVGRLDTFVAELPGPVRKDQFLGSLQGKFRDYEIKRAEEALKRLPDDAKLSPSALLNQIKKQYDPAYYRTQVVEPQVNSFYHEMDNVYTGPRGDEFPLGVIHLIQSDNPQSASKDVGEKLKQMINRTYGGIMSPEEVAGTRADISSIFGLLTATDKRKLARTWTPYVRAQQAAGGFEDISNDLIYPVLNKEFMEARFKLSLASPIVQDAELAKILQRKVEIAKNKYGIEGLDEHVPKLIQEHLGNELGDEATKAVRELIAKRRKELNKELRESNADFRSVIRDIKDKENLTYRGQHSSLLNENNPIAFSRFSEHTTDIPGLGTTKGIYVNELQSDRLDDIRKTGPYGGNPQKDLVNRLIPLQEKQAQLLNEFVRQKLRGAPQSKLDVAAEELNAINERVKREYERVTEGTYSLRESFPGMEESPQVIQQLMAKNVISAAINRGVNFVAFPGAESKQAQLYEKLPNNLRQVVKDLGPGFEFRPVTLKTPEGQEITHPAVVWGSEAANRIKQKGVPFKDGGEVIVPRETSTSKKQLDTLAQISQRKKA